MNAHVLYQMVRADFLERVRRYSFLLTLAGALYLGYSVATEKIWMVLGNGYRGVYNSAWIGALMAVCCSTFLSLAGFWVVKGSVQRDTDTRVGQILAATPMQRTFYTLAKTASNFAVLASMVAVLMAAAVVMQLSHAEVRQISLWKLWAPFLLITLPALSLTAALAVLFETITWLSAGFGNVAYFFAWTAALAMSVNKDSADPTGLQIIFQSTRSVLSQIDANYKDSFSLTIGGERAIHTFLWTGVHWTPAIILGRVMWLGAAVLTAIVASAFFHRFDPAHEFWARKKKNAPADTLSQNSGLQEQSQASPIAIQPVHLTPLPQRSQNAAFARCIASELRLMLQGQKWWWYAGAAGMFIGTLVSPGVEARQGWLLAAWIWPVLVWSQMGARESRYATQSLIFSSERSLYRQLPAVWVAGVMLALLTGVGFAIRLLMSHDWPRLAAWTVGALFIPSLALALGVWSGSNKAFEALYTVWWYIGPLNHTPGLDFVGTTATVINAATFLAGAVMLLAAAFVGRRRSLGYV